MSNIQHLKRMTPVVFWICISTFLSSLKFFKDKIIISVRGLAWRWRTM